MESVLKLIQQGTAQVAETGRKTSETSRESLEEKENKNRILDEMREILEQMSFNERWFQLECDDNLIDACIYQRESLKARYRYLLAKARDLGIQNAPFQRTGS